MAKIISEQTILIAQLKLEIAKVTKERDYWRMTCRSLAKSLQRAQSILKHQQTMISNAYASDHSQAQPIMQFPRTSSDTSASTSTSSSSMSYASNSMNINPNDINHQQQHESTSETTHTHTTSRTEFEEKEEQMFGNAPFTTMKNENKTHNPNKSIQFYPNKKNQTPLKSKKSNNYNINNNIDKHVASIDSNRNRSDALALQLTPKEKFRVMMEQRVKKGARELDLKRKREQELLVLHSECDDFLNENLSNDAKRVRKIWQMVKNNTIGIGSQIKYGRRLNILILGEMDFSLSKSIAHKLGQNVNGIATSYHQCIEMSKLSKNSQNSTNINDKIEFCGIINEKDECLQKLDVSDINDCMHSNIDDILEYGWKVCSGVDATNLDKYKSISNVKYDIVLFGLPSNSIFPDYNSKFMKNVFQSVKNVLHYQTGKFHVILNMSQCQTNSNSKQQQQQQRKQKGKRKSQGKGKDSSKITYISQLQSWNILNKSVTNNEWLLVDNMQIGNQELNYLFPFYKPRTLQGWEWKEFKMLEYVIFSNRW